MVSKLSLSWYELGFNDALEREKMTQSIYKQELAAFKANVREQALRCTDDVSLVEDFLSKVGVDIKKPAILTIQVEYSSREIKPNYIEGELKEEIYDYGFENMTVKNVKFESWA